MKRILSSLALSLFAGHALGSGCYSSMSLGDDPYTPVACAITPANSLSETANADEIVDFINGATAYRDAMYLGKDDTGTNEFMTFDPAIPGSKDGIWTSNYTTAPQDDLFVAFKFDGVPVELHYLGAVAEGDSGNWETWKLCDLMPDYTTCTGGWDISGAAFFKATNLLRENPPDPIPLPAAAWMFLGGLGLFRYAKRRAVR